MDTARLERARKLKAIINVETNFTGNVDFEYCLANGIHVPTPGSAFSDAIAESALGMAIELARDHGTFPQQASFGYLVPFSL